MNIRTLALLPIVVLLVSLVSQLLVYLIPYSRLQIYTFNSFVIVISLFIMSIVPFSVGVLISGFLVFKDGVIKRVDFIQKDFEYKKAISVLWVLTVIMILVAALNIVRFGLPPFLTAAMGLQSKYNYLNYGFFKYPLFASAMGIIMISVFHIKKRILFISVVIMSVMTLVLFVSRGFLIQGILQFFFLYIYRHRMKFNRKLILKVSSFIIIIIILFGLWGDVRSGSEVFLSVMEIKRSYQFVPTLFLWFFSYLSLPLSNMIVIIQNFHHLYLGAMTLSSSLPPIMVEIFHISTFDSLYNPVDAIFSSPLNNMATAAAIPYLDFGWVGVALYYFIIGVTSGYVNFKSIARRKPLYQAINAIILSSIALSFFWNMMINITIITEIILILSLFRFRFGSFKVI